MKVIEQHRYILENCPLTGCRIMLSTCHNCRQFKRTVLHQPYAPPGIYEIETLVCNYDPDAKGDLIPV